MTEEVVESANQSWETKLLMMQQVASKVELNTRRMEVKEEMQLNANEMQLNACKVK